MENYYLDERVVLALNKNEDLMDILTFVKEVNFEIKDNLGFDVLWDNLIGAQCINVDTLLLQWMGYEGSENKRKQTFIKLLESNDIEYQEIGYEDPLIKQFPNVQEEIKILAPMHLARKKWLIMEPDNFKEAIMSLTTKKSKEIRKYYLQLEKLVQLYGAYTYKFKENQLNAQIKAKNEELEEAKEYAIVLGELMVKDEPKTKNQVVYIATTELYAKNNLFKVGGIESIDKFKSRLCTYNTGRVSEDLFYYSDTFMVSDYHQIESRLKDLLSCFRNKKEKEMYRLHYTDLRYIVDYLCNHYSEEVDEVNSKLAQFIANLNKRKLRPVVPPALHSYLTSVTCLNKDGTVDCTTIQTTSFEEMVTLYISKLSKTTTEITKKKIFDDLQVKKDRKDKFPILRAILAQLRPEIKLILKQN